MTGVELLAGVGVFDRNAAVLAETWKSLKPVAQRRLLATIVERVEPHRTKADVRIIFDPQILDAICGDE